MVEACILFGCAFALLIYAHLTGVFDDNCKCDEANQTQINLTKESEAQ